MRISVPLLAVLAIFAAATLQAHATIMDFTLTMTLEGNSTLSGHNVNGETLTITGSYDTANDFDNGNYATVTGDVEYSLNGGADFDGTSPTTYDEPYYLELNSDGIINLSGNNDVIADSMLSLTGDSLLTPEVINIPKLDPAGTDSTTEGTLDINGVSASGVTLTITDAPAVATTPEPSSLILLSAGLIGFGGILARRRWLRA